MTATPLRLSILFAVVVLAVSATRTSAQSGYDLFQQALAAERADGDLRGAIQLYGRIVKEFGQDRALAARALVRIGECYEKLGGAEAVRTYERILQQFADQTESVAVARSRLRALRPSTSERPVAPATRRIWAPAVDTTGSVSPDGRYLSFTDWETGDLAVRDLIRGTNRRLTNTGGWVASGDAAEYSIISPDGLHIAYAWFTNRTSRSDARCVCRYELRVVGINPGAGPPRTVYANDETRWIFPFAWTPDGRALVVARQLRDSSNQLALVPVGNGGIRVLKSLGWQTPRNVSISGDGRYLAYDAPSMPGAATHDIFVLALDGSREWHVVQDPSDDHSAVWAPSSTELLFISNRTGADALWRIPVQGGTAAGAPSLAMTNLGDGAFPLNVTRDGTLFYAFGGPASNVYLATLSGEMQTTGPPVLVTSRFFNGNTSPAFSPDDEHLAYLSRRNSGNGPGSTMVVLRRLNTGEERELPLNVVPADRVSWFPDARSVLVAAHDLERPRLVYYRVHVDSGAADVILTVNASQGLSATQRPIVSPDGRAVYYAEQESDQFAASRLVRWDVDAKRATHLRQLPRDMFFMSFALSPDGNHLAYITSGTNGAAVGTMTVTGENDRELYRSPTWNDITRLSGIAWSPDQRQLLFVTRNGARAEDGTAVWKLSTAGGTPVRTGITSKDVIRALTLSRDGEHVAMAISAATPRAIWALEHFLSPQTGRR